MRIRHGEAYGTTDKFYGAISNQFVADALPITVSQPSCPALSQLSAYLEGAEEPSSLVQVFGNQPNLGWGTGVGYSPGLNPDSSTVAGTTRKWYESNNRLAWLSDGEYVYYKDQTVDTIIRIQISDGASSSLDYPSSYYDPDGVMCMSQPGKVYAIGTLGDNTYSLIEFDFNIMGTNILCTTPAPPDEVYDSAYGPKNLAAVELSGVWYIIFDFAHYFNSSDTTQLFFGVKMIGGGYTTYYATMAGGSQEAVWSDYFAVPTVIDGKAYFLYCPDHWNPQTDQAAYIYQIQPSGAHTYASYTEEGATDIICPVWPAPYLSLNRLYFLITGEYGDLTYYKTAYVNLSTMELTTEDRTQYGAAGTIWSPTNAYLVTPGGSVIDFAGGAGASIGAVTNYFGVYYLYMGNVSSIADGYVWRVGGTGLIGYPIGGGDTIEITASVSQGTSATRVYLTGRQFIVGALNTGAPYQNWWVVT